MAHGESIGGPGIHAFSWTMQKGVTPELEPYSGSSSAHPGLARLLVSSDRMPHGHRPAQCGQHLAPVCGTHATS